MPLSPGTRLGPYDIVALLGAGGMGEVYRARDTTLGRDVAIKIIPAGNGDAERLARFEREARVLATLNHPHIGAIYGVEKAPTAGGRALILELVEGETLADRLRRGPISVADSLQVARQIADALDAAHTKGVVHRDLKPANIIITPGGVVKVLDFGLAKTASSRAAAPDPSQSTKLTVGPTEQGIILGTVAYMSPEQARGKPVDTQTDIWAFGCVLYEALSGRATFAGETTSDTLAGILEREPDWEALPAETPERIRALLRRCLRKDPARRLHDIADARAEIDEVLTPPSPPDRAARPLQLAVATVATALALGTFLWLRSERRPVSSSAEWVQLTNFSDAASQPALSADGRMLAFIRGPGTFTTTGQIYLKLLPAGDPVPLTRDNLVKMSPVFSPDGARIAYTVREAGRSWDTWIVPALRGEPRRWLRNASGLSWIGPDRLLYSEIKTGLHMAIVTAAENRAARRELYLPPQENGMAHRSAPSPDGQSLLVVEMDGNGVWLPCRLVSWGEATAARPVGPPGARCTSAAWSPDGRWMYFSASAGDAFHLWRQRVPDGRPEQITSGPTEEEGLAIAPDGRSIITSVGLRQRAVWVRDASGERQISLEGYAYWPLLSADGQKVCYRVASGGVGSGQTPSELWMAETGSGRLERILPGQLITGFDLSRDDRVVASVVEADRRNRLWLAWLDGRMAPRRLSSSEGDNPRFGADGEIFFRAAEGDSMFLFRIRDDGTGREKVSARKMSAVFGSTSPDGLWLSAVSGDMSDQAIEAVSTAGRAPVRIFEGSSGRLRWAPDGTRVYLSLQTADASAFGFGQTYVLPLPPASMLPRVPPGGFKSEAELGALPGVEILPYADLAPGESRAAYAFSRETVTRNLYRIPLR